MAPPRKTPETETEPEDEGLSERQKADVAAVVAEALKGHQPVKVEKGAAREASTDETSLRRIDVEEMIRRSTEEAVNSLKEHQADEAHQHHHEELDQAVKETKPLSVGGLGKVLGWADR